MKKVHFKFFDFIFLATTLFWSSMSLCFPEMVRHGYNNCITCHVSPSGGGVLNHYGRSLSLEVMSFSGSEGEEQLLGFVKTPYWLNVGGDVRSVQYYTNTPTVIAAQFFL